MVVDEPGNHINGGCNKCNEEADFKCLAKTDDTIVVLVPVIAYAHKYQRKSNEHGGISQQHTVAHIHVAVTITVITHGK